MKKFLVEAIVIYESYNGYDHKTTLTEIVEARNSQSASNKAKKIFNKSPYVHRGYIEDLRIHTLKANDNL